MDFEFKITSGSFDPHNDNVDVAIKLDNGDIVYATFFTLSNVKSLFEKNQGTGECKNGLYLWASGMILVESLSESIIRSTIEDLINENELYMICTKH